MNSDLRNERPESSEWERWLTEHAPRLLLFARQQARTEADAQDLVQEAIVECWTKQGGTPPPIARVYATVRSRAIDLVRSQDRRIARETEAGADTPTAWFGETVEDRERNRLIEEAMRNLPDHYREVIMLKVWGGLTFAEIGEAIGVPANTAASRYRYALAELRKLTKAIRV